MLSKKNVQLLLLTVAASAAVYARTAVGPLQEAMRTALSLTDNQMALLQGAALALPMVLLGVPAGVIVDRYSRVRFMLILSVCNLIASLATALATNFIQLLAARCVLGFAGPASWVAALSVLADHFTPTQRGRANTTIVVGQCIGGSAAFALGGAMLATAGPAPDAWRWAMLVLSAPVLVAFLLQFGLHEPARRELIIVKPSAREACIELWRYRAVVAPLLGGLALLGIADGAAVTWVAPTFSRRFALSPDRIGAIMGTVLLVSGILGPLAGGLVADACHRAGGQRRTVVVLSTLALLTVPAGGFAVAVSPTWMSALLFVFATVGAAITVAGTTLLTIVVPNELRGLCMAVLSAAFLLFSFAVAPLTVSLLSGAIGGPAMLGQALAWVCTITSVLGAAAFLSGVRSFSDERSAHPTPALAYRVSQH